MVPDDDFEFMIEKKVAADALEFAKTRSQCRRPGSVVCKHWLRALCKKGDKCEFLHEYNDNHMPICWFYSKHGECTNDECVFRHINPDDDLGECPWYRRGYCKHGPKCRYPHVRRKMCHDYFIGFCPKGPDCKYAHPSFDVSKYDNKMGAGTDNTPAPPTVAVADTVMDAYRSNPNLVVCHKCGQIGHKAPDCTAPQNQWIDRNVFKRDFSGITCFKCGQKGHYANHCTSPGF